MSGSPSHSRNASEDTVDSHSAYPMILEHILQYPGSYEIPLRTMYTLNSAPRAQQAPSRSTTSSVDSEASNVSATSDASHFTSALMSHIAKLPAQPCSLPPPFIVSFVRRSFHPQLTLVDFPQGLAAMDYLRDLEHRRKKEVAEVLARLGLGANGNSTERDATLAKYPGVAQWLKTTESKESKLDAIYTQVYLGLRRWIMINEMCLEPFNKHNCMAMLNTLFPPLTPTQPTSHLTPKVLLDQRNIFFKYISSVERNGKGVLRPLQTHKKRDGDDNDWPLVVEALDKYLNISKNMIDDCMEIQGTENFVDEAAKRGSRKTDSGISFGPDKSKVSNGQTSTATADTRSRAEDASGRGLTTIEKITREFRRMRSKSRSRIEVEEIRPRAMTPDVVESLTTEPLSPRSSRLKKMKSASALSNMKHVNSSSTSVHHGGRQASECPQFDAEAMKRHRQLYDERAKHTSHGSA